MKKYSSKKYRTLRACLVLGLALLALPLSAQTFDEYAKGWYDASTIKQLKNGKMLGRTFNSDSLYLPKNSGYIARKITDEEKDIHMEFLAFVPFEKGSLSADGGERTTLWMLNSFLETKKMTNASYISSKSKQRKPLFFKAGRIKNPRNKKILSDLQFSQLPKRGREFIIIDMDKLGEQVLEVKAMVQEGRIDVDMSNPLPVKISIFTFAKSRNLQVKVVCEKFDDGVLIYELCQIVRPGTAVFRFLGLEDRVNQAMFVRFAGITDWIKSQLQ